MTKPENLYLLVNILNKYVYFYYMEYDFVSYFDPFFRLFNVIMCLDIWLMQFFVFLACVDDSSGYQRFD